MKRCLAVTLAFATIVACHRGQSAPLREDDFIAAERRVIEQYATQLIQAGRYPDRPNDYALTAILGRFEAHDGLCRDDHDKRYVPCSFRAYSFYRPQFDQAMRAWFIDGVMERGSDILHAVNINAKFTPDIVGHKVRYIVAIDAQEHFASAVVNAAVIELPRWADGSFKSTEVRLDKRAPGFALTYGIAILPPDYDEEMCACHMRGGTIVGWQPTSTPEPTDR